MLARIVDQSFRVHHLEPAPVEAVARFKITGRNANHQRTHYVLAATGDTEGVKVAFCGKTGMRPEGTTWEITALAD